MGVEKQATNSGFLDIRIEPPEKGPHHYKICLRISEQCSPKESKTIGIENSSFELPHHELWDSFFPLMYISRNGGPLFGKPITRARVTSEFPLHRQVVDFFCARAANFGLEMQIDSPTFDRNYDVSTNGDALLFGGGKDSRLLLGTLRDLGYDPYIVSAKGLTYANDLPEALNFETYDFSMPNRILPALMLNPERIWHGSGLGEVHFHSPWQQYFDISAQSALDETSRLLQSLGFDISFWAPQSVLPYNITQKILAERYPEIFAGQISVTPQAASEKNLHLSLIKLYHNQDIDGHCTPILFEKLLRGFVDKMHDPKQNGYGHNDNREIINREMKAIIYRLSHQGNRIPRDLEIPSMWDEPWIDYIHLSVNSRIDKRFLNIYKSYADPWQDDFPGLPDSLVLQP